jgi:bifunctional DNase/RNase
MTYDLMRSLVTGLGGDLNRVVVNNVTDTTFFAKVVMSSNGREVEIDSRPSDAIALALRAKVPIFADATVLEKANTASASN